MYLPRSHIENTSQQHAKHTTIAYTAKQSMFTKTVWKDGNKVEPLPRQALKQSRDHTTLTCFLKQAKYSIKTITNQSLMN